MLIVCTVCVCACVIANAFAEKCTCVYMCENGCVGVGRCVGGGVDGGTLLKEILKKEKKKQSKKKSMVVCINHAAATGNYGNMS